MKLELDERAYCLPPNAQTNCDRETFPSGAVRSSDASDVRYDLISFIGHRRLAETYAEGAKKYGDHNWLKGIPASNLLNHLERHIQLWKSGDQSEDHLAHAAWGLYTLMHFEETKPSLIDLPARQPTIPPDCQNEAKFVIGKLKSDL